MKKKSLPIAGNSFMIIGGASLVGTATVEEMLKHNPRRIVILDNFAFGSRDAVVDDPRVEVVSGDITRLPNLLAAMEGIDGVLHLAAMMTISMAADPWSGLNVNIGGVQNVVEACRVNRVRKLVFASSNAVYGYGPGVVGSLVEATPFHQAGAQPAGILYGASKIVGEQLLRDAYQRHGQDYVILRYSTVYGERQHYRAANAKLIMDAFDSYRKGVAPEVVGTGNDTKHFVYVGDVARANVMAFEADATDRTVNLSGPDTVTTRELINIVRDVVGSDLEPDFVPAPPGKVVLAAGGEYRIEHHAAKEAIGWAPEIDMRTGIRRLINWRIAQEQPSTTQI
jgi:UDP-glucose 4-epimerase